MTTTAESVTILVVRNESLPVEDFEALGITVEGIAPENVRFVHLVVAADQTPDEIHQLIGDELDKDSEITHLYVIEDDDEVTGWLEDTTIGELRDLDLNITTSEGYVIMYVEDADASEDGDD